MSAQREFTDAASAELLPVVRQICDQELAPKAAAAEETGTFPRDVFKILGAAGLLGLPFPTEYGGGGVPLHDYLQIVEELAAAWATVGLGVSVHTLSCFPLANFGSAEQKQRWLPEMLGGSLLGAYCLSEESAGSDAAALSTRATPAADGYVVNGVKSWISHGGVADYYVAMVRTSDDGAKGISCLLVDSGSEGLSSRPPERKLGFTASPTAQMVFENVAAPRERLIGEEGQGFSIALAALDAGRLGMAACAVGIAQAALDLAVSYAHEREQFGRPIAQFQGLAFLLADMATGIAAARALYLAAARKRDRGEAFGTDAAMAKLFATDIAMQVTTEAVQVLGGAGYVKDHPAERYFREAKALQIVEGTNQIQRVVISRSLNPRR
ncbi:MAG TPA: acyl-CoA dehydrogenase family protein [Actinomycetes bacterium]|nr:acyl-CoA dehydrogenase family protein [Actinomycetes bacterium]